MKNKTNRLSRTAAFLVFSFAWQTLGYPGAALAKDKVAPAPETLGSDIEVTVYGYKKSRDFIAVELGFTNKSNKYVPFTPSEIYLNDDKSYSVAPLTCEELDHVDVRRSHYSLIPLTVAIGLGMGAIGASGHSDVARGLAIGALGAGGAFVVSEALESRARDNTLIAFENNSLETVDKLPPGVTLGGFLYFPKVKKPSSLTIVTEGPQKTYAKKTLPLVKKRKSH